MCARKFGLSFIKRFGVSFITVQYRDRYKRVKPLDLPN